MSDERSRPERSLSRSVADARRAPFILDTMEWSHLVDQVQADSADAASFLPDGLFAVDPRDRSATLFNERRAQRPHDYSGAAKGGECPICGGKTTPIIDIAELTSGFTFLNQNLYPVVAPVARAPSAHLGPERWSGEVVGAHFLQWTSSRHDDDWPQLDQADRLVVMKRLAALEKRLLSLPGFPADAPAPCVSVIKNVGLSVGGSLSHGHQQIALTTVEPRRVIDNRRFLEETGEDFGSYMSKHNPAALTVAELDRGRLVVPYFMRRPYDMLYLRAPGEGDGEGDGDGGGGGGGGDDGSPARHLHELSDRDLADLANALALGMQALRGVLLSLGREVAYNVVLHTGHGGEVYLEFLPWSQPNGGFEQLGLSACQSEPHLAAEILRETV
jgi:galactose-1-phosphate uridylyltransferase